jgi:hypothetical protein
MKKLSLIVALAIFSVIALSLLAGPTIIRDKRITDIALTPVLGRGYTIVTNTFQSKCMDNVVVTDPSYDFQYIFESIEKMSAKDTSVSVGASGHYAYSGLVDIDVDFSTKTTMASGKKEFYHHIYVNINMDTYYASVDEARTRLSDSAANLLTNNDIPGFFSSCGSYYVRSLGRNAKFISVFTYTDVSETRDVAFEAALEMSVKSFGQEASGRTDISTRVSQQAGEKKLTITTNAYGLGKNEGATLISYDIETFKAAIKDAFISMQNPMTGKVTTMEVVPWVENTEFQNLIKLEKQVIDPETGKTMLMYKKKHILNLNSEYLAEIERADRNMMNIYYKAKLCKETIETSWAQKKKLLPEFETIQLVNNKFPSKTMSLKDLYEKYLQDKEVDDLLQREDKFMKEKGEKCIDKLLESGMFITSWRKIPECWNIRGELAAVISETVDEYCMPTFSKIAPAQK